MQDFGPLAVFKVTARDQGHYKGPSGAFVTYRNICCVVFLQLCSNTSCSINLNGLTADNCKIEYRLIAYLNFTNC